MPDSSEPIGLPVHPHQLEVQEFSSYELVIDARSRREYDEDHIPGAVSVPVESERTRMLGGGAAGFGGLGAAEPGISMPYALAAHVKKLAPGDPVLVYCGRGGLDSEVWAAALRSHGFDVDVLGGGWINYRRWVDAGLELLPRMLSLRVLAAPAVCGSDRVVEALRALGWQAVDVASLGGRRLIPGMVLPGEVPSQGSFESELLEALRGFDPAEPVWITTLGPGSMVALPSSVLDRLPQLPTVRIKVPLQERVRTWRAHLQSLPATVRELLQAICALPRPPAEVLVDRWRALGDGSRLDDMLACVVTDYLDHGEAQPDGCEAGLLRLPSLEPARVEAAVRRLLATIR